SATPRSRPGAAFPDRPAPRPQRRATPDATQRADLAPARHAPEVVTRPRDGRPPCFLEGVTVLRAERMDPLPAGVADLPGILPNGRDLLVRRCLFDDREVTEEFATGPLALPRAEHGHGPLDDAPQRRAVGLCGPRTHESRR